MSAHMLHTSYLLLRKELSKLELVNVMPTKYVMYFLRTRHCIKKSNFLLMLYSDSQTNVLTDHASPHHSSSKNHPFTAFKHSYS